MTNDGPKGSTRTLSFAFLALCFFGSGLTALIYELIWLRRLQLTFGSTTYSMSTVLAAFMAGLGFGSYLVGRWVDRSRLGGIRIYAYLELGIGFFGIFSLPLLWFAEVAFARSQSYLELGPGGASLLKFLFAFPVLAIPAGLMGGTLPALVRGLVQERGGLGEMVGKLYGINTAGAALGTALTGLLFIELVGLWSTIAVAVSINLGIGFIVLMRVRGLYDPDDPDADEGPAYEPSPDPNIPEVRLREHLRQGPVLFCAVAVLLTGGLSMLYEVAWTRMLSLVVGSSTYAFTMVLTIFLLGLALGSLVYGFLYKPGRWQVSVRSLALVLLLLACWVSFTLAAIPRLPLAMLWMTQLPGASFLRLISFEALMALFLLLVPTILLGAALPMSISIISRATGQLGRDVGGAYLVNTVGAIFGSLLTGFLLIPALGVRGALMLGLGLNLALVGVAVIAFSSTIWRQMLGLSLIIALTLFSFSRPRWPAAIFDAGLHYQHNMAPAESPLDVERRLNRYPSKLLYFNEGVNATISVRRHNDAITLFVNGKPDASSVEDMPHQVLLGLVAGLAHPKPVDVGIVGWGSGVTAYATTFFPEVKRVDVAEIERGVVEASHLFNEVNGGVHRDRRVKIYYDDARSYFRTTRRQYDVIISQPSNPWMVGVSNLFSRDFYQLTKRRLRTGGVFAQWLQLYYLDSQSVAMVLRTVLDSFEHVQLWFTDVGDVVLLASDAELDISLDRVRAAYDRDPRIPYHMNAFGPGESPDWFFGCFLLDRAAINKLVDRFPPQIMTDDQPLLEFWSVRALYRKSHPHMADLWKAKMALGQVFPPTRAKVPPEGAILAGGLSMLRGLPELREEISRWAMRRREEAPEVQLMRAKSLAATGRMASARALAAKLKGDPLVGPDATLLLAQILLRSGLASAGLAELKELGIHRPLALHWFRFQAMVQLGRHDDAWVEARGLLSRVAQSKDPDAHRIKWSRFYRYLARVAKGLNNHEQIVAMLSKKPPMYGGELFRLYGLLDAYRALNKHDAASKVMDQIMAYGLIDAAQLRTCEEVHGKAKQKTKADACHVRRMQLRLYPSDQSLWP